MRKLTTTKQISLEDQIKQLALDEGAALVGVCSADSLKDNDFSDANFMLPGAQSIVSIAIKMNDEIVTELAWQMGRPVRYNGEFPGVNDRANWVAPEIQSLRGALRPFQLITPTRTSGLTKATSERGQHE